MLSIGIDVSKGKSTVCGMKPGGEIVYTPFEVQHTRKGMSELVSLLHNSGEEVRVVLESTGSYHCPVVAALLENGIFVSVVNSLRMKRFCSQSIRKVKTDRIDAMQIALYCRYSGASRFQNAICDQVLPGMQELMSDHAGRHKLSDFVLRYRHTTHILEIGETRFRKDYCKWAKKRDTAIANVWQRSSLPQLKTVSLCFPMHHPRRSSLRKRYESSTQWRRPVTLF
ncbi:MAG: IS110 family transposase [Butyricicoccus sp.]